MFQKLKQKAGYLAVAAPVALLSSPVFAQSSSDFTAAVTEGVNKVKGMTPDIVLVYAAMIGVSALFWVGRRTLRVF